MARTAGSPRPPNVALGIEEPNGDDEDERPAKTVNDGTNDLEDDGSWRKAQRS
jgi:hypothetical protein